jgi:Ca2+-binding EF-hand superfamily protein
LNEILKGEAGESELENHWLPAVANARRREHTEDQILFHILRQEFIKNRDMMSPYEPERLEDRVSKSFNYGRYLSMCMGETLAEVVEVSISTWACMGLLASAFYVVMLLAEDNTAFLSWFMVGCAWLLSVFNYIFENKLCHIRNSFAPVNFMKKVRGMWADSHKSGGSGSGRNVDENSQLYTPFADDNSTENSTFVTDSNSLPAWCHVDLDNYNLSNRSKLAKWLYGSAPNRQQVLYWGQVNGTDFHLLIFRIILLFNGLYAALLAVTFVPAMYKNEGHECTPTFIVFCVVAAIPLYLQVTGKRRLVATMSHIACIGCLRRNHMISNVIREEKTSSAVRAFIVLHKIHLATQSGDRKKSSVTSPRRHYTEVLPAHITSDISKTFDLFDNDHSGAISTAELSDLMRSLGSPCDGTQLDVMVGLLDKDGDGDISKEEFIQWYSEQLSKNELDPHEMAKSMFGMFDKDGSGSITIAEFKEALDAFDVGLSTDDVAELVKELDEDRNGLIDEEEFAHLLKRHAHPPPELSSLSQMY